MVTATRCVVEGLESRQLLSGAYIDLAGVMPAALDLPHINLLLRRGAGDPLSASINGQAMFNVNALYNTGASGVIFSSATADALGIIRATHAGQTVIYSDVGSVGPDNFNVSELLTLYLAPGSPDADLNNLATWMDTYNQMFGPLRAKISGPDTVLQGLDVVGMPATVGKVVVIDARRVNAFADELRTHIYAPGTPFNGPVAANPGIPATNLHVRLSYASFGQFSSVAPAGAPGPTLASNPFIGPNPVAILNGSGLADDTPGVTVRFGAQAVTGSWLLDTGSSASILSLASAASLGVQYVPGTYNTGNPQLRDAAGNLIADQFTMSIGGAGGMRKVAGFYLNTLELPTVEGQTVRFFNAPVLVSDITVKDPLTQQTLTLDGVLGMNYLVASGQISGGGGFTNLAAGYFDWITLNQPEGLLGLGYVSVAQRPSVALDVTNVSGGVGHAFTVTYAGTPTIDWTSIDSNDIIVIGPDGREHVASLIGLDAHADGPLRVATYWIHAPKGKWLYADNGLYTVQMRPAAVSDTAGHFIAQGQLGAFRVNVRDVTPPKASAGRIANPTKGTTYTFRITYKDDVAVRAATIGHGDVLVTGPRGFKQATKLVSKSSKVNRGTIVATYRITAPGKLWDAPDKGTYVITLRAKQVSDASGNFMRTQRLGKFTYTPPKSAAIRKASASLRAMAAAPAPAPFSTTPIRPIRELDEAVWR